MRIFAVSDLHGQLEGLDPKGADVVIVAGDVAPMKGWGVWHVNDQVKWINKRFAAWCEKYPEVEFVVIPGNHDLFAVRGDVPTKVVWPKNVHYVVNREVVVKGLRIAGSSWIPPISGRWAFETSGEEELARRFAWIPEGLDILFTHTPPYVKGWNVDVSLQTHSPHFGSAALAEAIRRAKPKLAFCGHIHTGEHRVHELKHEDGTMTKIYNVARLNEDYCVAYEPRIEYACKEEDLVEMELEIDDRLKERAEEAFARYGIALEQGLIMMIEEVVSAQGEMVNAAKELRDRLNRIAR